MLLHFILAVLLFWPVSSQLCALHTQPGFPLLLAKLQKGIVYPSLLHNTPSSPAAANFRKGIKVHVSAVISARRWIDLIWELAAMWRKGPLTLVFVDHHRLRAYGNVHAQETQWVCTCFFFFIVLRGHFGWILDFQMSALFKLLAGTTEISP